MKYSCFTLISVMDVVIIFQLVFCKECKEPCQRGHSCSESQSSQAAGAVGGSVSRHGGS